MKSSFIALALASIAVCPSFQEAVVKGPQRPLQDPQPVNFVENILTSTNGNDYCNPQGQIRDTCCDYQSIETIQNDVFDKIQELVHSKFFRYYRANLWKECPFWNEEALCTNRDCSVATTDENMLPADWRKAASAVQVSPQGSLFQPFQHKCTYKDQDFCLVDDQLDSDNVIYLDLTENPERFTGYAGPSSGRIWKAIYEENCFDIVHKMTEGCETCNNIMNLGNQRAEAARSADQAVVKKSSNPFAEVPSKRSELKQFLNDLAEEPDGGEDSKDEVCLEKRVYYRLISGLHSSISIHICNEWFYKDKNLWGPNLDCFVNRIGSHPERLQNIYFTYALLLRAVQKVEPYLETYEWRTGSVEEDDRTRSMIKNLVKSIDTCPSTFDENAMFKGPGAYALKKEFRDHFRNVSSIMDCVGCEKCRLWGKLQTVGLGTALKVLFSYEDKSLDPVTNPDLFERNEIVALFNTFNRFSESIHSIKTFRKMYIDKNNAPEAVKPVEHLTQRAYKLIFKLLLQLKLWNIPVPNFLESLLTKQMF
ncbi:endoplasmic reticulum Oxidoreductin 1-domain-containing protein [Mycotypha africana]|uniref:endoplasmic reticulum Oxidoreductin 1-domain-containing protein n=1 Tax=Mycotypha africana TaxID=64632 RepID=UPI0022FFE10C|nr:endoplasmic reticulum Oxidoreductin 1-domain-containing protein [Mycotypha africana]KAI8987632.1 endoplasmic reticulum Oxidoreductin 1-domain-containing protein [Mycotypha africana]